MEPYKEMYLKLMRETERAINLLIDAQRACEELYLAAETEKNEEKTLENSRKSD